eukprot:1344192-Amorphochlora_amoeboformis.AAC.1
MVSRTTFKYALRASMHADEFDAASAWHQKWWTGPHSWAAASPYDHPARIDPSDILTILNPVAKPISLLMDPVA